MNDPHVVALLYRVHHHDGVDYSRAEPLAYETLDFRVEVNDLKARFELKQHYATAEDARQVVEPFIQNWEFDAGLSKGPGCFRFESDGADIIDRRPSPGVVRGRGTRGRVTLSGLPGKGKSYANAFPPPPSGINSADREVVVLFDRYERYKAGKEYLPNFANYCYTEIVESGGGRAGAAKRYRVSTKLLKRISELSSIKGGTEARKAQGAGSPLTEDERGFLERAVVRLIRRVAEYHASPGCLPEITIGDIC